MLEKGLEDFPDSACQNSFRITRYIKDVADDLVETAGLHIECAV